MFDGRVTFLKTSQSSDLSQFRLSPLQNKCRVCIYLIWSQNTELCAVASHMVALSLTLPSGLAHKLPTRCLVMLFWLSHLPSWWSWLLMFSSSSSSSSRYVFSLTPAPPFDRLSTLGVRTFSWKGPNNILTLQIVWSLLQLISFAF